VKTGALLAALVFAVVAPSTASAAKTPSQLLAASVAAARSASTVRIVAAGIPSGGQTIALDLEITAGKGGEGWISLGSDKISIVVVRPYMYFKANAAFWQTYAGTASPSVAQLFANHWVKVAPSNKDLAGLADLTDLDAFITGIANGHGALVAGGTKTIAGRRAIGVRDTSKSGGGTLWIAAKGTPFPLQLTQAGGSASIEFEDWNAPVHVKAPAGALDFSHVKG
jgi:hypothetical protein